MHRPGQRHQVPRPGGASSCANPAPAGRCVRRRQHKLQHVEAHDLDKVRWTPWHPAAALQLRRSSRMIAFARRREATRHPERKMGEAPADISGARSLHGGALYTIPRRILYRSRGARGVRLRACGGGHQHTLLTHTRCVTPIDRASVYNMVRCGPRAISRREWCAARSRCVCWPIPDSRERGAASPRRSYLFAASVYNL